METITCSNACEAKAVSIVYAIKGFLPNSRIFLFGTPFEPPLAAIRQIEFL